MAASADGSTCASTQASSAGIDCDRAPSSVPRARSSGRAEHVNSADLMLDEPPLTARIVWPRLTSSHRRDARIAQLSHSVPPFCFFEAPHRRRDHDAAKCYGRGASPAPGTIQEPWGRAASAHRPSITGATMWTGPPGASADVTSTSRPLDSSACTSSSEVTGLDARSMIPGVDSTSNTSVHAPV